MPNPLYTSNQDVMSRNQKYNAFVAYHKSKKSLEAIKKWLDDNGKHKDDETLEKVITLDKKLKKLIEKLNE